ncbi:hypothetical protein DNTS_016380 [Danionella cerebrum]|uniref:Uncharacterized protein n=1 Tax=Danionella cerebrum TaxID=2873325 RepID=A0A553PXK3_9TELE|nr:hypothetical protein DNTS_016380 [Danionella translucida]
MVFLELFTSNSETMGKKNDNVVLLHFCFALIGLEKLMDQEFSCPCDPGFNTILISSLFMAPALLALCVMVFIQRPCRQSSSRCVGGFLFCLIPPLLWTCLLLLEGDYVACGAAYWEGDCVLDEEFKIKWCKPTDLNEGKSNGTKLLELTERIIFYSRQVAKPWQQKQTGDSFIKKLDPYSETWIDFQHIGIQTDPHCPFISSSSLCLTCGVTSDPAFKLSTSASVRSDF